MDTKAVGRNIRFLLRGMGITESEFANKIHVNERTLERWLNGDRQITVYALKRSADCFGVPMELLTMGMERQDGIHKDTEHF